MNGFKSVEVRLGSSQDSAVPKTSGACGDIWSTLRAGKRKVLASTCVLVDLP